MRDKIKVRATIKKLRGEVPLQDQDEDNGVVNLPKSCGKDGGGIRPGLDPARILQRRISLTLNLLLGMNPDSHTQKEQ
jgi:hypothetical protein